MADDATTDMGDGSPDAEIKAAFDLYAAGHFKAAAKRARDALETTSDPVGLRLVIGLSERRLGRQRIAVEALAEAVAEAPARADIWTALGMCRRDLGRREEALDAFEAALDGDPEYARAHYQYAVVLQELDRDAEAVEVFRAYVDTPVGRDHALAWSLLGVGYRKLERFDEAAAAIEKAIELDPADIPTRNALVITHYVAGNEAEALAAAHTALRMKDEVATRRFKALDKQLALQPRTATFDPMVRDKNIIAFSLWGDDPVYTHGAIVNAQLAPNVYPGWRCRFYCDDSVPAEIIAELRRLGAQIQVIRDPKLLELKPLWRFLVSDDAAVEYFICRDADSRLNSQEAVAVDDWLKSGLPFHVMRDHVYHMEVILAGMWGGAARVLPNIRELTSVAGAYARNKWNDQEFLRDVVWPLIRNHARVHDSLFGFRGAGDFPPYCRLPGKIHVGGAIKSMRAWPPAPENVPKTDT